MSRRDYDGRGELHISGIRSAREEPTSQYDRVITVCQDNIEDNVSDEQEYNFFCMSDGPSNEYGGDHSYDMFRRAATTLWRALADDETVLIHCHQGQSRSVSVATAALGRLLHESRSDAYDTIRYYRPQAKPDHRLMGHASTYIEEHTSHSPLWSQYEENSE